MILAGRIKHIAVCVASVAAVVVYLSTIAGAYGGLVNPEVWVLPALFCTLFPWLFAVTVVVALSALLWSRKMALAGAAVIALTVYQALSLCPLHFNSPDMDEADLTVMTYNSYYFTDWSTEKMPESEMNLSLQAILDADADIVLLQEALSYDHYTAPGGVLPHRQAEELCRRYPFRLIDEKNTMNVLSKYPIRNEPVKYDNFGEYSFMIERYVADVRGQEITLFNIHLQSLMLSSEVRNSVARTSRLHTRRRDISAMRHELLPKLTGALRERAAQARELRQILDSVSGPVILGGDFNDVPLSYASRVIQGDDLTDVYASAGLGAVYTFRSRGMYFRIDQMFCGGGVKPLTVRRVAAGCSDHYPLMAGFKLTE